jgi:hypothetical protein
MSNGQTVPSTSHDALLKTHLFANYNSLGNPKDGVIDVYVNVAFASIVGISSRDNFVEFGLYLRTEWVD